MDKWSDDSWITVSFEITPTLFYILWGAIDMIVSIIDAIKLYTTKKQTL
jgi:hypothetical protein